MDWYIFFCPGTFSNSEDLRMRKKFGVPIDFSLGIMETEKYLEFSEP